MQACSCLLKVKYSSQKNPQGKEKMRYSTGVLNYYLRRSSDTNVLGGKGQDGYRPLSALWYSGVTNIDAYDLGNMYDLGNIY